jgi:hypothetical protein
LADRTSRAIIAIAATVGCLVLPASPAVANPHGSPGSLIDCNGKRRCARDTAGNLSARAIGRWTIAR